MGVQNSAAAGQTADINWRKSSATASNNCVEAAFAGELVLVRDSKDPARTIGLSHDTWQSFLGVFGKADQ
jgi:hypothetical protein